MSINPSTNNCDLSVVIITRNEEEMIAACIESVLEAVKNAYDAGLIDSSEVILSDSASTDKTIEIAKNYPIKIVQLHPDWPLSAPAGLYTGFLQSTGDLIYFIGGDMVLDSNWFINAIPHLTDENIAAVTGVESEFLDQSTVMGRKMTEAVKNNDMPLGEVDMVGTAIFKRNVLEKVGPHNPYLKGGEDRDISYRIKAAGYNMIRIDKPLLYHYWAKKDGKLTFRRYLRSLYVWSKGDGQAARSSIGNKVVLLKQLKRYFNTGYLRIYGSIILAVVFVYMNFLSFYYSLNFLHLLLTLLLDVIIFMMVISWAMIHYAGGTFNEFIFSFHVVPYAVTRHVGFIRGFFTRVRDVRDYPKDPKIIK